MYYGPLWANNVKLRHPQQKFVFFKLFWVDHRRFWCSSSPWVCNLAGSSGIPQFSLHAWFLLLQRIRLLLGAKLSLMPLFRIPVKPSKKVSQASPITQDKQRAKRRFDWGISFLP